MNPSDYTIINRVSLSSLQIIDLEDYFPSKNITSIDIAQYLEQNAIVREKDFREKLNAYPWEKHKNSYVYIFCSADVLLPSWTYLLVASHLITHAKEVVNGTREDLIRSIYLKKIQLTDYQHVKGKPVLIKGCSKQEIPNDIYIHLLTKIQPLASSIIFGEACSGVSIYKKQKQNF